MVYHWHSPPKALLAPGSRRIEEDSREREESREKARFDGIKAVWSRSASGALARLGDTVIDRHVAISAEIETLLTRSRWTRPEKILRLPNALPDRPERAAQFRDRPEPFVLGSVANFRVEKDHPTLLRAFARCLAHMPDLRLDLVGEGETRLRMQALAQELGIESRVRFLGNLDDPRPAYREMDAFLLSTHYEGHCLVILEAMAHGLSVIATDLPSVRETLAGGELGLLVAPRDPEALCRSILRIVSDRELRSSLAVRSRSAALAMPTTQDWAKTLADLYESLAID